MKRRKPFPPLPAVPAGLSDDDRAIFVANVLKDLDVLPRLVSAGIELHVPASWSRAAEARLLAWVTPHAEQVARLVRVALEVAAELAMELRQKARWN